MKPWEDKIRKITPYTPGEQPNTPDMIKLNTNENPYPPTKMADKAMKEFDYEKMKLYPHPNVGPLVIEIANYYKITDKEVFVGVGSDDVIATAFMAFFNGNKPILFPDVTYSFYPVWAKLLNIPYETIPLDLNLRIISEDYYKENGGIILPNPNAPTSIYESLDTLETILQENQDVIVIIDEAYIDFSGPSATCLLSKYENLLIIQTFSKSRSMAGMRIGFAIGSPILIQALNTIKHSYNSYTMNHLSISCGVEAIKDDEYFRDNLKKIIKTREWVEEELRILGFSFPKSGANFLFIKHNKIEAKKLQEALREKNIYVRYFPLPRIDNYLRVTVGTDEQMNIFISFLKEYVKRY